MINSYAVAAMRAAQEGFCTQRGMVLTRGAPTYGPGGANIGSTNWTARAVDQPMRIRDKTRKPIEVIEGGKETSFKECQGVLPWSAIVSVGDRLAVYRAAATTILLPASSAAQRLASVDGIGPGTWLYFETAGVSAQVKSVSGITVNLDISVATTRGETVLIALRGSSVVASGATGTTQTLGDASALLRGSWVYFRSAQAAAMVAAAPSGNVVTLDRSVASTSREVVFACDLYEVQAHDSGKGHATEVIADLYRLDDGQV